MATMDSITQSVLTEIRDLAGVDVQVYTQPVIYRKIQSVFNIEFRSRWWMRHLEYITATLDELTGTVTSDISAYIKDARDIKSIWLGTERAPLPLMASNVNPANVNQPSLRLTTVAANGYIKVYPLTTSGELTILCRTKPDNFTSVDEIPFDEEYMIQKVAGDLTIDEGVNPTAGQRFLGEAGKIRQRLLVSEGEATLSQYSSTASGLTEWSTR